MPKRIEANAKRVHFHCMLSPATLRAINDTVKTEGGSQGEIVDRAVALLAFGEEIGRTPKITRETVMSGIQTPLRQLSAAESQNDEGAQPMDVIIRAASSDWRSARGIRPKGDAKR